ncbi:Hypothetical predicted protein [Marmota monax]|uniref:Uncharacterized protein n=1 Tax=Marmota monax TaxID=9995 RepID=A0A5E4ALC4_MARMO|nr:hypothetical protein GHT09_007817 [Marmota monax]VTJ58217.1 Hypothetical predicted protein [Marmota monax]
MRPRDRKNRGFPLSRNWKTALTVTEQPNGPIGCLERAVGVLKQPMAELCWSFLSASYARPESAPREAARRRQAVETLLRRQAQGSGTRRWGAGACSPRTSRVRAGGAVCRAAHRLGPRGGEAAGRVWAPGAGGPELGWGCGGGGGGPSGQGRGRAWRTRTPRRRRRRPPRALGRPAGSALPPGTLGDSDCASVPQMTGSNEFKLNQPPEDGISSVKFSPNTSQFLLVSSWDTSVRLYDVPANSMRLKYQHTGAVLDCAFYVGARPLPPPPALCRAGKCPVSSAPFPVSGRSLWEFFGPLVGVRQHLLEPDTLFLVGNVQMS